MEPTREINWEQAVARMAQRFEYPATPDVAAGIGRVTADGGRRTADHRPQTEGRNPLGRLVWVALVIVVLVVGALAVPQTRAALLSLFARIGAIEILIDEAAPTVTATATQIPQPAIDSGTIVTPPAAAASSVATSSEVAHSLSLQQLGDPVTLDEARRLVHFDLLIPAVLGDPNEIYIHRDVDLPAVTLVWRDENDRLLSLTEIAVAEFARKMVGEDQARDTRVNGRPAVWIEGPHLLQLLGNWEPNRLRIASNVLVWTEGDMTLRLEGYLGEDEMIAIAESMAE